MPAGGNGCNKALPHPAALVRESSRNIRDRKLFVWLKPGLEETQIFGFENHLQTFGLGTLVVNLLDALGDDIHVGLGIDSARDGQPGQLEGGVVVVTGLRVAI